MHLGENMKTKFIEISSPICRRIRVNNLKLIVQKEVKTASWRTYGKSLYRFDLLVKGPSHA